jgi:hypothetical protein
MAVALDTPYLDDGIRSINFFNGRLLSGEDLTQERQARQAVLAQLGRAAGDGVAYGLWVTSQVGGSTVTSPTVTVGKGLAVNRAGEALELVRDLDVSLVAPVAQPGASNGNGGGGFGACSVVGGHYLAGTGVYLLLLAPARGRLGRAPASGLGTDPACAAKYLVDGVRFRLVRLTSVDPDLADAVHLRNLVAHACLGTSDPALAQAVVNPFGPALDGYGLLDALRPDVLTDRDVPLAVVHWTDVEGVRFVDNWSVRRRLAVAADADRVAPLVGARRRAEAEATLLQFQEQVDAMRATGADLAAVAAGDAFRFLPPAGLLPYAGTAGATGFDVTAFFAGQAHRKPAVVEGALVAPLLRDAAAYAPIAVESRELVWLYLVREDQQALTAPGTPPQPWLLFTSGDVPYRGSARFDLGKWGYASYAVGAPGGAP